MNRKIIQSLLVLNCLQIILYLFGFFNRVALQTGKIPWVDVTRLWQNFYGIMFWSIVSMLCVIGFTLALYLLISRTYPSNQQVGLIITAIGYGSPLFFSFFLLVPATLLVLGTIFIKILIPSDSKDN